MNSNDLMRIINKDFPDYEIVNIEEIGLPIFKKNVTCLATFNKRLSDVLEFTLKLLALKYEEKTIAKMLALDEELIKHAIYDLDALDMIDFKTLAVTEEGRKYLQKNSYETLKKIELPININSYSGYIREDKNYTSNKNAKNLNLNTIKPLLDVQNNQSIEAYRVKKILKDYMKKANSDLEVDLVGIVGYSKKSTQYMKLSLVVLNSPTNEVRLIVYNSNNKLNELEHKLIDADEAGIRIFKEVPVDFFNKVKKIMIQGSTKSSQNSNYIDILSHEYFGMDNQLLDYVVPLINLYTIDSDWILTLERYLGRKMKVSIKFVGESYPSAYIKNRVLEILKLKEKYPKFINITHDIEYEYASLMINSREIYVDELEEFNLGLKANLKTVKHVTVCYEGEKLLRENKINIEVHCYKDKNEMNLEIEKLIRLSKELDATMEDYYGLTWLSNGQILNQAKLLDFNLAKTESNFSEFTKGLTSSFVEVLSVVGREQGMSNYMFDDFKERFPVLFKALNRLRVYRNSMQHNDLDEKNRKAYLEFLKEDLNGQFPEFISKGYLHLQRYILEEILNAVEQTTKELTSQYS